MPIHSSVLVSSATSQRTPGSLKGTDHTCLLEMASTGEVASFGKNIHEAYWASLQSTTGFRVPRAGSGVLIGGDITKPEMAIVANGLVRL